MSKIVKMRMYSKFRCKVKKIAEKQRYRTVLFITPNF